MFSRCRVVTTSFSPQRIRKGTIRVITIDSPEKIAPVTKYGGKIVVCQPGMTEVAKSKLTIVWTLTTRGVARPASIR